MGCEKPDRIRGFLNGVFYKNESPVHIDRGEIDHSRQKPEKGTGCNGSYDDNGEARRGGTGESLCYCIADDMLSTVDR
jgi:hypothetical protein